MPRYRVQLCRTCINAQSITVEIDAPSIEGAKALATATNRHEDDPYFELWSEAREEPQDTEPAFVQNAVEINQATEAAEAALRG